MSALRSASFFDAARSPSDHPVAHLVDALQKRLGLDADFGTDESLAHLERVSAYAEMLVRKIGVGGTEAAAIGAAARLHDIGKVAIPSVLLNWPGKLNAAEIRVVQTHTMIGHDLLVDANSQDLALAATIARSHHERWDGTGYPDQLSGEQIPLAAQVVAVADTFDALTTDRVYRPAFPVEAAVRVMEDGAGSQFDPKLVSDFLRCLTRAVAILEHLPDAV